MSNIYSLPPSKLAQEAVKHVIHKPFWQSTIENHQTQMIPPNLRTDVLVVGGGFTGLWSAVQLRLRYPSLRVALVDKSTFAGEATSRNGGFIHSTLTHGFENSLQHWPDETSTLIDLGNKNFSAIKSFIAENHIECDWIDAGELETALLPSQIAELERQVELANSLGLGWQFLDFESTQQKIHNPQLLAASFDPHGVATMNPAKLALGLVKYLEREGVELFQHTEVTKITRSNGTIVTTHSGGEIHSSKVIVASGAHFFVHPLTRMRTIPIYDYSIVSRVLHPEELQLLGWQGEEGVIDTGNQFHYYRLTPDRRILWGGYAANYHFGSAINESLTYQQQEFAQLAQDFFALFPNLKHIHFEYAWGGVIDTCSRFVPFFQTSHRGQVVQAAGFTGLGVATSRFAADVMIDLIFGETTERTALDMVKSKPVPFPPEPLRSLSIWLTRASLLHEDRTGKRNLWLRLLDLLGVGFDS